jgi:DNA polymerase I-like protein with 3'-5' exonuclease and polymerase domains
MVAADEAGVRLQLQVHDELDFTIWKPEEALECAEVMRHALPCNIPAKVDIEVGPNWGEIKEPTWAR